MENAIETKSFEFAVRIVNLYKHLTESKKEFVLSKQLIRSGTSIGANRTEYLTKEEFNSVEKDIKEIIAILVSICKKTNT